MKSMKYTATCADCGYTADFESPAGAITAAEMHADLGPNHVITTTRPAHGVPGSVPVIVAITNPQTKPRTTVYTTDVERYRLDLRK